MGSSTGISKIMKEMWAKSSPQAVFETDEERSYFIVRLPVHERALSPFEESHERANTEQVGTKSGPSRA